MPSQPGKYAAQRVDLWCTPAQARVINRALALLEAELGEDLFLGSRSDISTGLMTRTRERVHDAMHKARVKP